MRIVGLFLLLSGFVPGMTQDVEAAYCLAAMWCSTCYQGKAAMARLNRYKASSFAAVSHVFCAGAKPLREFWNTPHAATLNFLLIRRKVSSVSAYSLRFAERSIDPNLAPSLSA